jgi:hypothetical protein
MSERDRDNTDAPKVDENEVRSGRGGGARTVAGTRKLTGARAG